MKRCLLLLILLHLFNFVFNTGELYAANPVPADCISLTQYYPRAPESESYHTFTNPLNTYDGYKPFFRVFIPPGTLIEDLNILEFGDLKAVIHHKTPPTGLPDFPPSNYVANNPYLLSELETMDRWAFQKGGGLLPISRDSLTSALPISRAGWLYVKVGSGDTSFVNTQFSAMVDSKVFNEWWDKYIKNEAGWNEYVQNVGEYIDPTKTQPVLKVTPLEKLIPNTAETFNVTIENTGTGTMSWNATVDVSWLKITPESGTDNGTIVCTYEANTNIAERKGLITVTAPGATSGSVSVTQAGSGGRVVSIIPDTGLTKCFNSTGSAIDCPAIGEDFYGQDGSLKINPISYTKLDANGAVVVDSSKPWEMIKDNVTGLIWEAKTKKDSIKNYSDIHDADNVYPWLDIDSAANTVSSDVNLYRKDMKYFIDELNKTKFGGFDDWRLPTIGELITLTSYNNVPKDSSVLAAAIDSTYFPNTQLDPYWSSSEYVYMNDMTCAWALDFRYGNADFLNKDKENYVRAVRGPRTSLTAADRFIDNKNGTVTDKLYGLMWQQKLDNRLMNWQDALSYCNSLPLGNYEDWRLPSVKELQSLVEYSKTTPPAINSLFELAEPSYYWAATTVTAYNDYLSYAWFVDFIDGAPFPYSKNSAENYVRAVREVPLISVRPTNITVGYEAGTVIFDVYISGRNPINWIAKVLNTTDSLFIIELVTKDGAKPGTVTIKFNANTKAESRTATIRVEGVGADNSLVDVMITQEPMCTAVQPTILLQLPYIVYESSASEKKYFRATFSFVGNEKYKLDGYEFMNPSTTCTVQSTLTFTSDIIIDIPYVEIGGIKCKMKLVYQPAEYLFKVIDFGYL